MPVDTESITQTANFLANGGVAAVISLLLVIIGGMLWERNRLLKK